MRVFTRAKATRLQAPAESHVVEPQEDQQKPQERFLWSRYIQHLPQQ